MVVNRLPGLGTALILIVLLVCDIHARTIDYSSSATFESIRWILGTKTRYYPQQSHNDRAKPPPSCVPKYINVLSRHGERWPTEKWYYALEKLANWTKVNSAALQRTKFKWAANWENPMSKTQIGELTDFGAQELYDLGKRLLQDYPKAFEWDYPIRTTAVQRTSRSANSFGFAINEERGKLGKANVRPFYTYSVDQELDSMLRSFNTCEKYRKEQEQRKQRGKEEDAWLSKMLPPIAQRISGELNLTTVVPNEVLEWFYTACTLVDAKWCELFSKRDIEVFEYADDLETYYELGYGSLIGQKMSCRLLNDTIKLMLKAIEADFSYLASHASLKFAHAETVIPFLALLGLYRDDYPLPVDVNLDDISGRNWRSSRISPFAANVAFILHECSDAPDGIRHRVEVLHNERQVILPKCPTNEIFCPLSELVRGYKQELNCSYEALCGVPWGK